jgi:hypothetical protein
MPAKWKEFADSLFGELLDEDKYRQEPLGIEIIKLDRPEETRVVVAKNVAIPFVFEEAMLKHGLHYKVDVRSLNYSGIHKIIYDEIRASHPDIKDIHPPVVIMPENYGKCAAFVDFVRQVYSVYTNGIRL